MMTSTLRSTLQRTLLGTLLGALAVASIGGCAADDDALALPDEEQPTISRTIVHVADDGTTTVSEDMISPAEQRAEIEARTQRLAAGGDSSARIAQTGCDGSSIWIFDDFRLTGNEICFYGSGSDSLRNYRRPSLCSGATCWLRTWAGAVRSYWAGSEAGTLYYISGDLFVGKDFTAWERADVASDIAQRATTLLLL